VAKLLGGGLHNSSVVRGMVLKNDAVGSIKKVEKAKVSSKGYSSFTLHTCYTFESSIPFFFIDFEVFLMEWSMDGALDIISQGYEYWCLEAQG
jgi:hypothetical protein